MRKIDIVHDDNLLYKIFFKYLESYKDLRIYRANFVIEIHFTKYVVNVYTRLE